MRKHCPLLFIILFSLMNWHSAFAAEKSAEDLFFQANQAYKGGSYTEAVELYNKLISSGHYSGHFFYNLGNAYFRAGDLGRAILNYKRANLFIPRDADLQFNLSYAGDRTRDAAEELEPPLSFVFFWVDSFNLDELFYAFALANLLFFSILLVRLFIKSEWTYYFIVSFVTLWLITGLSFGAKYYQLETDQRVVVFAEELNVLAGPDQDDTVLFKLHAGTIAERERSEDNWSLIRLADEKRGWVESESIGSVKVQSGLL